MTEQKKPNLLEAFAGALLFFIALILVALFAAKLINEKPNPEEILPYIQMMG